MLEKIYSYFKGYVTVFVKTNQPERFLNIAVIKSIYLWDLKKLSENEMTFKVSIKGFKKLREVSKDVKAKIKILKKIGFFKLRKKILKKKIIISGLILVASLMIFLSSLILNIEIIGNETVKTEAVLQKLSEINLQKFKFRSNIDSNKISIKLINELDNIAWVGVYEKGTKLTIEIKERNMPPKMVPLDTPCHIVAKKDGIIKKMNVKNGEPLVSLNEVVFKGQVLVSGIINTKFDGLRYVHSMADIIANTWWESFLNIKLYEYEKIYTNNSLKKIFLKAGDREFVLSGKKVIPYYNYDKSDKRYILGAIEIVIRTYDEYTLKKKPISEEEAIKRGKEALLNELYKNHKKEDVKEVSYETTYIDDETRSIRILANLEEDIANKKQLR